MTRFLRTQFLAVCLIVAAISLAELAGQVYRYGALTMPSIREATVFLLLSYLAGAEMRRLWRGGSK